MPNRIVLQGCKAVVGYVTTESDLFYDPFARNYIQVVTVTTDGQESVTTETILCAFDKQAVENYEDLDYEFACFIKDHCTHHSQCDDGCKGDCLPDDVFFNYASLPASSLELRPGQTYEAKELGLMLAKTTNLTVIVCEEVDGHKCPTTSVRMITPQDATKVLRDYVVEGGYTNVGTGSHKGRRDFLFRGGDHSLGVSLYNWPPKTASAFMEEYPSAD